jgi:hypothetical protein
MVRLLHESGLRKGLASAPMRGTRGILTALASAMLICLSALGVWHFAHQMFEIVNPVVFSDLNADAVDLLGDMRLHTFVFSLHNEHIVATTRLLSAIDYSFFGAQYRLHQIAIVSALLVCATSFGVLLLRERAAPLLDAGLAAFAMAATLTPPMVSLVDFPYFLTHPLTTAFAIMTAIASVGLSSGQRPITAALSLAIFGALTLVSGGHGIALTLCAIAIPMALRWRIARPPGLLIAAAIAVALIVVWALFFIPVGHAPTDLSLERLAEIATYGLRVLGTPAHFAFNDHVPSLLFGVFILAVITLAIWSALMARPATPLVMISTAILVGHLLAIGLISISRTGTPWSAETEKYYFYTAICIVTSTLVIWRVWWTNALASVCLLTLATAIIGLSFLSYPTASLTKAFFRSTEAAAAAMALGIPDPQLTSPMSLSVVQAQAKLKQYSLNFHGRAPLTLIDLYISEFPHTGNCKGHLDVRSPFVAANGATGIRLEGWALPVQRQNRAAILVISGSKIIGAGHLVSPRPDVIRFFRLTEISENAVIGWKAYAPAHRLIGGISLYALGQDGRVCKFFAD